MAIHRKNPLTRYRKRGRRFQPAVCNTGAIMTFEECELAVLRQAVDENEQQRGLKMRNQEEMQKLVKIVEDFLETKKLLCYGGTAINNILPKSVQFYDYTTEIPDYDFFSSQALEDAKELADVYVRHGYTNVEAKSGVHHGTYKVYVNFIPMADVTHINAGLFRSLSQQSLSIAGIRYVPANFLRMSMYLELSRPEGDTSRWEKVLKRLTLLNKYHPVQMPSDENCNDVEFQRAADSLDPEVAKRVFHVVRNVFTELGVVFFGGYASALYSKYSRRPLQEKYHPDFDVLCEDPQRCATILTERLADMGITKVSVVEHPAIGELIPESFEYKVGKDTIAFLFKPIACHNYNTITIDRREVRVATVDTILSFYLAFLFIDDPMFVPFRNRHLCLVNFLFELEQKNRLAQKGLLRRFTANCYGSQETLESIRAKKAAKFAELKTDRNSREYQEWFLNYRPLDKAKSDDKKKTKKMKPKSPVAASSSWNPLAILPANL